jgi:t-SNARE complex subunit (syntaxin)
MKVDLESERPSLHEKEVQIIETKIAAFYVTLKDRVALTGQVYQAWKEAEKTKVKRQIRNLDAEQKFSDQQIEELVEEDPAVVQRMVSEQLFGKTSARLQYAANDILEKCEGIRRLQRNVRELVDMMREISQMVALQGEKVNTIATHVAEAKDMTRRGVENLVKAKEQHSSSRSVG